MTEAKGIRSLSDVVAHLESQRSGDAANDAAISSCVAVCQHVQKERQELRDAVVRMGGRLQRCVQELARKAKQLG